MLVSASLRLDIRPSNALFLLTSSFVAFSKSLLNVLYMSESSPCTVMDWGAYLSFADARACSRIACDSGANEDPNAARTESFIAEYGCCRRAADFSGVLPFTSTAIAFSKAASACFVSVDSTWNASFSFCRSEVASACASAFSSSCLLSCCISLASVATPPFNLSINIPRLFSSSSAVSMASALAIEAFSHQHAYLLKIFSSCAPSAETFV
mmetsp:Transcript_40733/g.93730  ORF Transcript_40733/g.93730 Transcript_40733/m.93730 type:complete len:211 (+) Transcript_40733:1402-2034(+)